MKQRILTWSEIRSEAKKLNEILKGLSVYGIPRGGGYVAAMLSDCIIVDRPEDAHALVDDLIDSGATRAKYKELFPEKSFYALYDKLETKDNRWYVFPWEEDGDKDIEDSVRRVLQFMGEDTTREGLLETPKRYIKFLKEFCSPPEFNMTQFEKETDEMIIQRNIPFYSLCEHHLAPFFGIAHIAYIPDKQIVGLSKLARTVEWFSRRPQNQERITEQISQYLEDKLKPRGVAVVLQARHLCVEMRGVKKPGSETITSSMKGFFKTDLSCRTEFLNLIKL